MVRLKVRYLVGKIQFEDGKVDINLKHWEIPYELEWSMQNLYGQYGVAVYLRGIGVKYVNPFTGMFFLKCKRDFHKQLHAALTSMTLFKKQRCNIQVLHMAATLKRAEQWLLNYNKKEMSRMYKESKTPLERQEILGAAKKLGIENLLHFEKKDNEEVG